MAEVGVLNLTIHDNSAEAGSGLGQLAGALDSVKNAAKGFTLSKVATSIKSLIDKVQDSSTVMKQLTGLFNSISGFQKLGEFKFDTKSFDDLKEAVNGINIGTAGTQLKAMKDAFSNGWKTDAIGRAVSAMGSIREAADALDSSGTASKLSSVASALRSYNNQIKGMPKDSPFKFVGETVQKSTEKVEKGVVDYQKAMDNFTNTQKANQLTFKEPTSAIAGMAQASGINISEQMHGIEQVNNAIKGIDPEGVANLKQLKDALRDLDKLSGNGESLSGYAAGLREITSAIGRGANSYHTLGYLATSMRQVKEQSTGFKLPDFSKLITLAQALQENYNASSELKKFAEGLSAMKEASANFVVPKAGDVQNAVTAMSGAELKEATATVGSMTEAVGHVENGFVENIQTVTKEAEEQFATVEEKVQETAGAMKQLGEQDWFAAYSSQFLTKSTEAQQENIAASVAGMNRMQQRIDSIRNHWADATDKQKQVISEMVGIPVDQIWQKTTDSIQEATGMMTEYKSTVQGISQAAQLSGTQADAGIQIQGIDEARDKISALVGSMDSADAAIASRTYDIQSRIEELAATESQMTEALAADVAAGRTSEGELAQRAVAIRLVRDEQESLLRTLQEMNDAQKLSTRAITAMSGAWSSLKSGVGKLFSPLTHLGKQFVNIAKRMAIRAVIRQFVSGIKEGVENMYNYSNAIGTNFASSMDAAVSSMSTMKNSLGAAAAPIIQAIVPALQTVISWVITAINYLNQFFALLRGQSSWTRAVPATTNAFDKQAKAAKGAGGAIKDLLADWDELNIIQSQGGGGGGGGAADAAEEYLNMFEEVSVFDKKIKDIVEWIQDHFETIKGIALAIGAAILAWKLSSAFLGGLSSLQSFIAGAAMITIGVQLAYDGAYNAGLKGEFSAADLIETASGMLLSTIGGALIGYRLGGAWGAVIGGATGFIVSVAVAVKAYFDGKKQKELQDQWGKLHLSDEQIQSLVDSEVTAKVTAWLDITKASIRNRQDARTKANLAISRFSIDLESAMFTLKTDPSKEGVESAVASAKEAINTINESLKADNEGLKISFTKFTYKDKNGKDITESLYADLTQGNIALQQFFTSLGDDIAMYISQGFQKGMDSQEWLMGLKLMNTLNNIVNTAERNYEKGKILREAEGDMRQVNNQYDLETAQAVLEKQNDALLDYKKTTMDQWNEDLETYYRNIEYYKQAQKFYEDQGTGYEDQAAYYAGLVESAQLAIDNTEKWLNSANAGTYDWSREDETYNGIVQRMAEMWNTKLMEWYMDNERSAFMGEGTSMMEKNPTFQRIASMFGINPLDWFTDEDIKGFYDNLYKEAEKYGGSTGETQRWFEDLAKLRGLPIDESIRNSYFPIETSDEQKIGEIRNNLFRSIVDSMLRGDLSFEDALHANMASGTSGTSYPQEMVNQVVEESYDAYMALFEEMYKDMMSGVSMDDIRQKYAGNGSFAEIFAWAAEQYGWAERPETPQEPNDIVSFLASVFGDKVQESVDYSQENAGTKLEDVASAAEDAAGRVSDAVQEMDVSITDLMEDASGAAQETVAAFDEVMPDNGIWFDWNNQVHFEPPEDMSEDANAYIQAFVDAINSGMAPDELGAVSDQAFEKYGVSAFTEALPYINQLITRYKEMYGELSNVDVSGIEGTTSATAAAFESMASRIHAAIASLQGLSFSFNMSGLGGGIGVAMPRMAATGAFVKSGDLVMANENGNFEMMGRMGNQPVIANNQQIVAGISTGVSNANGDVVSELRGLGSLMRQMINQGLTAKVVPSSSMGRNNARSAEAYDRVSG